VIQDDSVFTLAWLSSRRRFNGSYFHQKGGGGSSRDRILSRSLTRSYLVTRTGHRSSGCSRRILSIHRGAAGQWVGHPSHPGCYVAWCRQVADPQTSSCHSHCRRGFHHAHRGCRCLRVHLAAAVDHRAIGHREVQLA